MKIEVEAQPESELVITEVAMNGEVRNRISALSARDDELVAMMARVESKMTDTHAIMYEKISEMSKTLHSSIVNNSEISELKDMLRQAISEHEIFRNTEKTLSEEVNGVKKTAVGIESFNLLVSKVNVIIISMLIIGIVVILHTAGII